MNKIITKIFTAVLLVLPVLLLMSCGENNGIKKSGKIVAVSSITIINDIVKNIGKDKVEAISICEVGIDPHTYKSKPSDPRTISSANIVFINGFTLEHWIEEMVHNAGGSRPVITVTKGLTPMTDEKGFGDPDPHAWFDVKNVKTYADNITEGLVSIDKANEAFYRKNLEEYKAKLDELDKWILTTVEQVPKEKRILITSHDAFRYFGRAYGFDVKGLQGISTEAKVQTEDVKNLIDLVKQRQLKSVFIETSVNPKLLEEISRETGAKVGGVLFSDSVGNDGTEEGTYIGAVRHNVNAVVNALK
ncbi:MAG: manganese transporter [Ignavibacteriae bacterium]|nr:MAG: manganese transporter [Ignavibacteriota bacterium]